MNTSSNLIGQVLDLEGAIAWRNGVRSQGRTVVLTNGCFDILHRGHVEYLQASAKLGDKLLVAVNSDRSVQQLKGLNRPVQHEFDRAMILAALRCVSNVFVFEGPRLAEEICLLQPDVYTKAGDYALATLEITERKALESCGVKICFLPFLEGRSTTRILDKSQSEENAT